MIPNEIHLVEPESGIKTLRIAMINKIKENGLKIASNKELYQW
jgi:hypothetical protein